MIRTLPLLLLAALMAGCASFEVVEAPGTKGPDNSYTVDLPMKWVRVNVPGNDQLIVTRDGGGLQRIAIARLKATDAFPRIKKAATEKLLPSELADLQIAEAQAPDPRSGGEGIPTYQVLENAPAKVGGQAGGFRVRATATTPRGLKVDQTFYGIVHKGYYYRLAFEAPQIYYFPKYRDDFEKMVASFRLN